MGLFRSIFGANDTERKNDELQEVCRRYTYNQERLKVLAGRLYEKRKNYLHEILRLTENIKSVENLPNWCDLDLKENLSLIADFKMAVDYEKHPQKFAEMTDSSGRTAAIVNGKTDIGTAIDRLGPSGAMSIATVVGAASTGTAVSALTGVAATNAALVWLGGGAIAAGGAGMLGGSLMLGMFGPVGLAVAGVSAVSGFLFGNSQSKAQVEKVQRYIDQIRHDNVNLEPKISHLTELISRSDANYRSLMMSADWLETVQPKDFKQWNDNQKHEFERLLNVISNSVQLINERI